MIFLVINKTLNPLAVTHNKPFAKLKLQNAVLPTCVKFSS